MENKDLLIRDLGCRIYTDTQILVISDSSDHGFLEGEVNSILMPYHIEAFKAGTIEIMPYLRSMSSMTEEEKKELLRVVVGKKSVKYFQVLSNGSIISTDAKIQSSYNFEMHWVDFNKDTVTSYFDWLNAHRFDYRGLIKMKIALKAPIGMYK